MSALPAAQFVPWSLAALFLVVIVALIIRERRPGNQVDNAVLDVVHLMSEATTELREGMDQMKADQLTSSLLALLNCVAVGITDREGVLLSWDGGANDHYYDLEEIIATALRTPKRELISHEDLDCDHPGTCRMRRAVIVPLIVEARVEGALIVIGRTSDERLCQMADAVARFVCIQFELAQLEESRHQRRQAEVKALRAQISPHFVYNSLNTISALIHSDPDEAQGLLQDFAEYTRYSFRTSGMFTSLAEELRNVDRYLTLESARYGSRLQIRIKIAPEVLSVIVPFLTIQPLVENAVKHGLANKPGGGTLSVIAEDNANEVVVKIDDDGIGMDPARVEVLCNADQTGAHVGLGNISQRMLELYGPGYPLTVDTAPGLGTEVILRIPKFARGAYADLAQYAEELGDGTSALPPIEPPYPPHTTTAAAWPGPNEAR